MIILIVEDEPLIALSLEAGLLQAGYRVLGPSATVERALQAAAKDRPDLALVDINLRGPRSGIECARELRARWNVPSLFLSGARLEAYQNKGAALGFLAKPYETRTALASVVVAGSIIRGEKPRHVPHGLELFDRLC